MGTVYEAQQEQPRRAVALKLLKSGIASSSALRRFEYEAQLLARLRHPGIAQIYEAGTHSEDDSAGGVPYFAMEYIPNAKTIRDYAASKSLSTRETLELFTKVCEAVHHGHQKGIIHRDLKPGNILVSAAGQVKIIDFGVGEPDFDVPAPVADAAIRAIEEGHSHYIDPRGLPELREQVARFEGDQHNLSVDPDQIVITTGTFGALSIVSRAILNPGDEVIVIEPLWDPYRNVILLTGATPVGVPMPTINGRFVIDADRLAAAVTPRTKAILVNTPWNPTGRVLTRQELIAIADVATARDLWIIADEVYSEIVFDEARHISIASLEPEIQRRTIVTTSLSKSFALTGWRIGYCVAPPELSQVLGRLNHYTTRGAASMVQHAAIAALADGMQHDAMGFRIAFGAMPEFG